MVSAVRLIDLVADVPCEPDDRGMPDLEAACAYRGTVRKGDIEAVYRYMFSLGNGFLGFPENQFYLIIMQIDIGEEHDDIIIR